MLRNSKWCHIYDALPLKIGYALLMRTKTLMHYTNYNLCVYSFRNMRLFGQGASCSTTRMCTTIRVFRQNQIHLLSVLIAGSLDKATSVVTLTTLLCYTATILFFRTRLYRTPRLKLLKNKEYFKNLASEDSRRPC